MLIKKILKSNALTMKIVAAFFSNKNKIKWLNEKKKIEKQYLMTNFMEINEKNTRKSLIIVPHADDELIGCYQLIKENKENTQLFYCGFTGNDISSENKEIRLNEIKRLAKDQKINIIYSKDNVYTSLASTIEKYKPEIIFLPSFVDWHWQHRECNTMCLRILDELNIKPLIGWYQISVPILDRLINYKVRMTKADQKEKWSVFYNIYKSQKHMPSFRFELAEKINAMRFKLYAAEVFSINEFEEWKLKIEYLNKNFSNNEFNQLQYKINDLIAIRERVNMFWSEFPKYSREMNE